MGRASSQPKSLSISSSAPSSRPFSGAVGPAPTRLNISSKTLFNFSTAPFPLSFTRPRVQKLNKVFEERSEEHTSELQSLTNLVCRLLLENKNVMITQMFAHI